MSFKDVGDIPSVCLDCKFKVDNGDGYRACLKLKAKLQEIKQKTKGRKFECLYKENIDEKK